MDVCTTVMGMDTEETLDGDAREAEARFHANQKLADRIEANRADPGQLVKREPEGDEPSPD